MNDSPPSEAARAHAWFSAGCFNATWDFIEKAPRSGDEDLEMLDAAHASLWHWRQRPDGSPANLSTGYWQLSRVYALLGEARLARRYGQVSLDRAGSDPFLAGFAHEALARAASVAGDAGERERHLALARKWAEQVTGEADADWLRENLGTVER